MIIHYLNLSDVDERIIHYLNLSDVDVVILNNLHLSDVVVNSLPEPKSGCIVDGSQLLVISLLYMMGNIFPVCAASVLVITDSI
jgi:membrane-anchored protein YejM (alkaline phosphatase superfamily)